MKFLLLPFHLCSTTNHEAWDPNELDEFLSAVLKAQLLIASLFVFLHRQPWTLAAWIDCLLGVVIQLGQPVAQKIAIGLLYIRLLVGLGRHEEGCPCLDVPTEYDFMFVSRSYVVIYYKGTGIAKINKNQALILSTNTL